MRHLGLERAYSYQHEIEHRAPIDVIDSSEQVSKHPYFEHDNTAVWKLLYGIVRDTTTYVSYGVFWSQARRNHYIFTLVSTAIANNFFLNTCYHVGLDRWVSLFMFECSQPEPNLFLS